LSPARTSASISFQIWLASVRDAAATIDRRRARERHAVSR
jgi:hypothetical protein